mgnify:CR=1 FL=1
MDNRPLVSNWYVCTACNKPCDCRNWGHGEVLSICRGAEVRIESEGNPNAKREP